MAFDFDYFVIGAGSGGVRSARIAAAHGAKVAIAEEYRVGGTCVIRGCVPKKLLVMGAAFAGHFEDAARFGWTAHSPRFDWPTLRDHVAAEVDRLNRAYQQTLDNNRVTSIHGRATIVGANRVAVDGREITARHVLVASGARPHVPAIPGAEHGITSNEIFHLAELPQRAVICGGGYIANEFAGILNQLGVEVTMALRSDTLLRGWDRSLAERLLAMSKARGIAFRFDAPPERLEKNADGSLLLHCGGKALNADLVLFATGRVPNSEGLGLEALGLQPGQNGAIAVDAASHTALPWLHAVGDVTDRLQLTPIAIREGHALADELFGGRKWRASHECVPSAVFSNPPLASVGPSEEDARQRLGDGLRVFTAEFRPMQNSMTGRDERCFYKLLVDASDDRVIAAHMIGPESPEILQALAIAVKAGVTKAQLDETVALHPSMAEELVLMR